jgi:general secretion pathway protein G
MFKVKNEDMKRNGFTLIELLIVISILGILAALVTVNFNQARQRARDVSRKNDLKQIQNALELYKNDQSPQTYSPDIETLITDEYMDFTPQDPKEKGLSGSWIDYQYTPSGLTYTLSACLENEGDVDKDSVNSCPSGLGVSYTLNEP